MVTFGGALFAAFPEAYASVLSGFYLPVILVLLSLIGRAISIEFRSKSHSRFWRGYWDFSFFLSSLVATLVFGVARGNVVGGVELSPQGEYVGGLRGQVQPFALAVGLLAVAGAAMHGALAGRHLHRGRLLGVSRQGEAGRALVLIALGQRPEHGPSGADGAELGAGSPALWPCERSEPRTTFAPRAGLDPCSTTGGC